MKIDVKELMEMENISEIEIVEMIHTYQKLVSFGVLSNDVFDKILVDLGIEKTGENVYSIDEDTEYSLS